MPRSKKPKFAWRYQTTGAARTGTPTTRAFEASDAASDRANP
jgi:hypothetical protein